MDASPNSADELEDPDRWAEWQHLHDQMHAIMLSDAPPLSPTAYLIQLCNDFFGAALQETVVAIIGWCACNVPVRDPNVQEFLDVHKSAMRILVGLIEKENYTMTARASPISPLSWAAAAAIIQGKSQTIHLPGRVAFKATTLKLRVFPPSIDLFAGPVEIHILPQGYPTYNNEPALPILVNGSLKPLEWIRRLGILIGSTEYAEVEKMSVLPGRAATSKYTYAYGVNLNMPWAVIHAALEVIEPQQSEQCVIIRVQWHARRM